MQNIIRFCIRHTAFQNYCTPNFKYYFTCFPSLFKLGNLVPLFESQINFLLPANHLFFPPFLMPIIFL